MYTYSGGPPQNPNLDPILFAELPFFSNWELAQMTKWGMPGVYTHAFMDGWSPGYLGSVAYNHNGMMRMYETQSGRDGGPGAGGDGTAATGAARCDGAVRGTTGDGGGGAAMLARRRAATAAAALDVAAGVAGAAAMPRRTPPARALARAPTRSRRPDARRRRRPCRGAARRGPALVARRAAAARRRRADRPRRRSGSRVVSRHPDSAGRGAELHAPQQHELHADRRALRPAAHVDVPEPRARELLHQDEELDRAGRRRRRRTAT